MSMSIVAGLLIPFLGTTAGAACVFFLKKQIGGNIQRIFTGFAAGVMVAASPVVPQTHTASCHGYV